MPGKRLAAPWIAALLGASALASVSVGAPTKPQTGDWGFDATGMDTSAKPGDDFFKYVNGGWDARTEIPADRTGYGVDFVTADNAELHLRGILEAAPTPAGGADAQKIHAAYLAFMDEARARGAGRRAIAPDLAAIRAAKDRERHRGADGPGERRLPVRSCSTPTSIPTRRSPTTTRSTSASAASACRTATTT